MAPQPGSGFVVRGNLVRVLHQEANPYDRNQGCDHVPGPLGQVITGLAANSQRIAHVDQDIEAYDYQRRRIGYEVPDELADLLVVGIVKLV